MANYNQLRIGSTGEDVRNLQDTLKRLPGNENLKIDGIYGEQTKAAVTEYQRSNGLSVDGIAGDETLGHLYGASTPTQAGFTWSNQQQLDNAWDRYYGRESFSYNPETDPLYNQYLQQYTNLGLLAMEDTAGTAASLTGGYGNSYAQTVGQQTYQGYLQQLNNALPALYSAAYDRYQAEGEALYNEAMTLEQRRQQAYREQQDNFNRLVSLLAIGYFPTDAELAAAGMTRAQARAIASQGAGKT